MSGIRSLRFVVMIVTSTVVMYGVMFLNTYSFQHVYFSETRLYMALLMGATMAALMLLFMRHMYENAALNGAILGASAVLFVLSLWLVRSQSTVEDASWMRAMIPHHSIAILTSERAHITDPRVQALADQIVATQRREIEEMKRLLHSLEQGR